MTIFVTGATGVLGQPAVRLLRAAGHEVKAFCRSQANRETLAQLGAIPVEADLFDVTSMAKAIAGCEAVLHLATRIPPATDMKKRGIWTENDRIRRQGMKTITEAALRTQGVRTVIYPSVSFFYADGGSDWIDAESAKAKPVDFLLSTLDAEAEVARFGESSGDRRGIVLRFGAFYGPSAAASRQTLEMARKRQFLRFAAPAAYRSFIWVDDAATAVVKALARAPSGIFDVVEDSPSTQEGSRKALADATGKSKLRALPRWLLFFALPADLRKLLARSQRISNRRFRDATGWAPSVPSQAEGWALMVSADPAGGQQAEAAE